MKLEVSLSQMPELEQKLVQGYGAEFRILNLSEGSYLTLLNFVGTDSGKTKIYNSLGRLEEISVSNARKLICDYYKDRELHTTSVQYIVFTSDGKVMDEGYLQDQFGKGLLNPNYVEPNSS